MSNDDDFKIIRGSGNVFRDLGRPNADAAQLKALLAAQIITALDERGLSVRAAGAASGFAAADFSRIRQAKLDRFTIDRLMAILNKLDRRVVVSVTVAPRATAKRDTTSSRAVVARRPVAKAPRASAPPSTRRVGH